MRSRIAAVLLGMACLGLSIGALTASIAQHWSFGKALHDFVVSNVVIGLSFGLCGALIAWHRPRNPIGWMYAGGGTLQAATAFAAPLSETLRDACAPGWLVRSWVTVFQWAWPLHVGIVLPLSLLLFPDGRLPTPRWRPIAWAVGLSSPLFVVEIGTRPGQLAGLPDGYGSLAAWHHLAPLWNVSEARWSLTMLAGVVAVAVRYRLGDEQQRRQLLWLLAAASVVLMAVTPFALAADIPVVVLFAIPLLPASIGVAILRHQLLDIRLVFSRAITYALLSALLLAGYAALVIVLSGVASTLVVALLALPLRARLQRAVDRLMYGERGDPLRVASRVGGRLEAGLEGTVEEIREALRLPFVVIEAGGGVVAAACGAVGGPSQEVPLGRGAQLRVGLRAGQQRLDPADDRVLALLAGPLGVAVHATGLSEELSLSRERIVSAREEERRRLRRDLHDGLGPLLTGVALSADAAANLSGSDPTETAALLAHVRADTRTAIAEVRQIVENLRPAALDELGLLVALEMRVALTSRRVDGAPLRASVDSTRDLPPLPAAIEVAAYRIATEALTNVVRHSTASQVVVRVACGDALSVEIEDNGQPRADWLPGVGITAMRERTAELGGLCRIGPSAAGGRVSVSFPLVTE